MQIKSRPTVLVTGCSEGGLGAALCHAFRKQGYRVFAAVRDLKKASFAQEDIEVVRLDVTSSQSIEECAASIRSATDGSLDVLVNNAGKFFITPLLDAPIEESREVFDVHVWGTLMVTQAFAPMLVKAKGVVLNISSTASAIPIAWQGIYSGSKAAVTSISETLRIELGPLGVCVITGMVGEVETQVYKNHPSVSLPKDSFYSRAKDIIISQASGGLVNANEPAETTAQNLVNDVMGRRSGQVWRGGMAGRAKFCSWYWPRQVLENFVHVGRGLDTVARPEKDDHPED